MKNQRREVFNCNGNETAKYICLGASKQISLMRVKLQLSQLCIQVPMSYFLAFQYGSHGASLVAQLVKNLPAMQETLVWFLGQKIHWRRDRLPTPVFLGCPCASAGKESACNAVDLGLIPGLGRSPGEGRDYPLQYSGLENSMACIVHGVTKSLDMTEQLSLSSHQTHEMWPSELCVKYETYGILKTSVQKNFTISLILSITCRNYNIWNILDK